MLPYGGGMEIGMVNSDTIKLLRECNAGIKMGVATIDNVFDKTENEELKRILNESKQKHEKLGNETHELLNAYEDSGKEPNPMAKGMSWIKTNVMLSMNPGDKTVSDLITDGCNMGAKSLNKYLNEYEAAEEKAKKIAKRLITLEEELAEEISCFL